MVDFFCYCYWEDNFCGLLFAFQYVPLWKKGSPCGQFPILKQQIFSCLQNISSFIKLQQNLPGASITFRKLFAVRKKLTLACLFIESECELTDSRQSMGLTTDLDTLVHVHLGDVFCDLSLSHIPMCSFGI